MLLGEYDSSGTLIREYLYANGEPLAQIDAGSPETILYLHTDHLLTARYATNAGGSTVWTWDSGAFGAEAPTGSASVNLRFPGQYYDAETGLHYNWHSTYDPTTGRYITSDPLGLAAGLNTYGYAAQNPLSVVDPDGQYWWIPAGITAILWGITIYNNWDKVTDAWNHGTWCDLASQLGPQLFIDAVLGYTIGLGIEAIGVRISSAIGAGIAKGISKGIRETAEARAKKIHSALDPRAQRHRTTAVTETKEGTRIVTSSSPRLTPKQRKILNDDEIEGIGKGHAEPKGVKAAEDLGLTPTETAATRPVCKNCQIELDEKGIDILTPRKE